MQQNMLEGYRLSPQQRHLWMLLQLGWSVAYQTKCVVAIKGSLDSRRLKAALENVIERHEILRTTFQSLPGMTIPMQVIRETGDLLWQEDDLKAMDSEASYLDAVFSEPPQPFDFERGPLLRIRLIKQANDDYVMIAHLPSICGDAAGLRNLVRETSSGYAALMHMENRDNGIPQYADLAQWQNELIESEETRTGRDYWRQRNLEQPPPLQLAFERVSVSTAAFEPRIEELVLDSQLAARIEAYAESLGTSFEQILLACWQVLLWRHTGQADVEVGTAFDGRRASEIEGALGLFAKYLPVTCHLEEGLQFSQLVKQIDDSVSEVIRWQEYFSWDQFIDPSKYGIRAPFFAFCFERATALESFSTGDVVFSILKQYACIDRYKIKLSYEQKANGSTVEFHYNSELFSLADIQCLTGQYQKLLESLVVNPDARIGELEMLPDAERHQLFVEYNSTDTKWPQDKLVHELISEQAKRTPEAIAVYKEKGITYRELNERANELAYYLRQAGVGPEVIVGLCMDHSIDLVISLLSILKAGGAYLPLDPSYPQARLSFMLEDANVRVVLTQSHLRSHLPPVANVQVIYVEELWGLISESPRHNCETTLLPDNLAYVIYTSGSTGKPKGVMLRHSSLKNYLQWAIDHYPVKAGSGAPVHSSLSFDLTITGLFTPLLVGGCVHMLSAGDEVEALGTVLGRQPDYSLVKLTPAHLHLLSEQLAEVDLQDAAHALVIGGENLPATTVKWWRKHAPSTRLFNEYGPTECVVGCCIYEVGTHTAVEKSRAAVPIGRPIANTGVFILDRNQRAVARGVLGELCIGGEGLARGYLCRADLTAEKFIPHPYSTEKGARLYRTGDLGRHLADGQLECLGRIDEQVKVRGYRIELGEIEAVMRELPGVYEAVVTTAHAESGQRRLIAYVVGKDGLDPNVTHLRQYLNERLPDYMVPATFITLDALPLSANGKVNRKALPDPNRVLDKKIRADYVAPRNEVEAALALIWSQVLGVERVGVKDRFFDLGGDSILSIQVVARAHRMGLRITPTQIFQHQSIAELALVAAAAAVDKAEQGEVTGEIPLTPIQHWFFAQEFPSPNHFNQSVPLELREWLDPTLLERAFEQLISHHDALRLRFNRTGLEWRQFCVPSGLNTSFSREDLSMLPEAQQTAAIEAAAAKTQTTLDIAEGPLLRVKLFELGPGRASRLLIVVHHLAIDGVSWRILLEDLQTAYEQLNRGDEVALPSKTTSFKRWAEHLQERAQSEDLLGKLEYWLAPAWQGAGRLPLDHDQGINTVESARSVAVELNMEETRALLQEVPQAYQSQINDALLTALAQVLASWTGVASVLVDLEGHGRDDITAELDVSRTVGWFTNIYPVLLRASKSGPGEALKSVKEQLRQIPNDGQGYGLMRYLCAGDEASEAIREVPQAEVIFNYLGQFDNTLAQAKSFAPAKESVGPSRDGQGKRTHLLEINASVIEGRLRLAWTFSEKLHCRETIETVAQLYIAELRALIAHCLSAEAGGYTPSDFPLVQLSQSELDSLVAASVSRRGNRIAIDNKIEDIYPLSSMQHGMLFHSLLEPDSGIYFEQLSCTLRGKLDEQAFEQAWQHALERHSVLRTSFMWEGRDEAVQIVWRSVKLPLVREDWRELSKSQQEERFELLLQTERSNGFDLTKAPLISLTLCRVGDEAYRFIWSHHHLLMDGWCMSIILKDVFADYEAISHGEQTQSGNTRPYRDYIAWLQNQDASKAEAFWRKELQGFAVPTSLGNHHTPPFASEEFANTSGYSECLTYLSAQSTDLLRTFARDHQLTVNTVVQGAWALLLSSYSGEEDVVFGATVSGRPADLIGVEQIVGLFINTLPVRVCATPESNIVDWLRDLQERQLETRQYEFSSLVQVQGWSEVRRGSPLFESIIVFENYPIDASLRDYHGGLEINDSLVTERTNFPITATVLPGAQLLLRIDFDTQRFDGDDIRRLLGHFATLLKNIVAGPNCRLAELTLLSLEEQRQLVVWNETKQDYEERGQCLHQLIEAQAKKTPDSAAVIHEEEQLSYGELNERANQLAHYLGGMGVGPEVLVGLCLERSLEMVVSVLAVLKAGGAYVPLDPEYPRERLSYMLADAGVSVLLTQSRLLAELAVPEEVQVVRVDEDWKLVSEQRRDNPESGVGPDNLAYVMYTSGSTGHPKGVMVYHASVVNYVVWMTARLELSSSDRVLQFASINFDISAEEIYASLIRGAALVLRTESMLSSISVFLEKCAEWKVSVLDLPTAYWHEMTTQLASDGLQLPISIRVLYVGGEKAQAERLAQWQQQVGRRVRLANGYGPTETTIVATMFDRMETLEQVGGKSPEIPIGRPISNVQTYVVDGLGRPVAQGIAGELHVGGEGVARGYLKRPELTAEKFVPDPFSGTPGARLYRTGDMVRYRRDGELEFLGRTDHQVKVRGHRIELDEIEAALRQQPMVREAVVLAREDSPNDKRLVAYLVYDASEVSKAPPTVVELRKFLRERLPQQMLPSAFVQLEKLPMSPNGKIDRRALPAPDHARSELDVALTAPRTPTEEILSGIWTSILGLDRVGRQDEFFELGGHSLLAMQVISRVREAFKIELPLRKLFEASTLAEFAEQVEVVRQSGVSSASWPISVVSRSDELPLSFAQQRLWFLDQLEPDTANYNSPAAVRLRGKLDVEALGKSLNEIIRRHEILRTNFPSVNGRPTQVISLAESVQLSILDLTHLPDGEREARMRQLAKDEAHRAFDLSHELLLRMKLLKLGTDEHVVLFTMHHIISDGWSLGVLVKEVATLYEAYIKGEQSPLPELEIQYADYAAWQRESLQGEVLEEQLGYWQRQLGGELPVLELPTDRARPAVQSYRGAHESITLSEELTQQLKALSQREGCTLFMTLLAAFQVLLHRYTRQDDIVVGTVVAGRTRVEVEPLIGLFINSLVLRTDLSGDPSFRELLRRVREVTLGAYAHQAVPFEKLVEELQPERAAGRAPLFQVAFGLQNAPLGELRLGETQLSAVEFEQEAVRFDLTVWMVERAGVLSGVWTYSVELFDAERIERMQRHYAQLLQNIVAEPEGSLSSFDLLTRDEKEQEARKEQELATTNYHKFMSARPKALNILAGQLGQNIPLGCALRESSTVEES